MATKSLYNNGISMVITKFGNDNNQIEFFIPNSKIPYKYLENITDNTREKIEHEFMFIEDDDVDY